MTLRVLLVDDEPGIRNVLQIYLKDAGFDVAMADNGKEAAHAVGEQRFDIVLTDIRMPGMDGIALLKHIKEIRPQVEVIMITGHGDYSLAIESLKLDAVDFITKPLDNDALDIALKRARDRIKSRRQIEKYTQDLEALVKEKTGKLEESKKRYRQLFNASPSYITIQDKDLKIIETNRVFKEQFSFEPGTPCYIVYKNRKTPCDDCPVIKTFEDGLSHTAEMEVVLKDAGVRNIFVQTSAIRDAAGRISHVMEMSTDVTQIRELQDHLASLGLHIGSVSHSLKQVLTGIDGGSYLIESGLKKENNQQISEGWDIVKERLSTTRRMVLDILYHSKKREPKKEKVLLDSIIDDFASAIQPVVDNENVNLILNRPAVKQYLYVDPVLIMPAFAGILENAVEACCKVGKPEIRIDVEVSDSSAEFRIRDNGPGIPKDKVDKVFDLFYSDKGVQGTGLGLFIAMRSAKQHKGYITVESEPGEYTLFTITLPLYSSKS